MKKRLKTISICAFLLIAMSYLQIGHNVTRWSLDNSFFGIQKAYAEESGVSNKDCLWDTCSVTILFASYDGHYKHCSWSDGQTCKPSACFVGCDAGPGYVPVPE